MNRLLLAVCGLLACGQALAQTPSWNGPYLGVFAGMVEADTSRRLSNAGFSVTYSPSGSLTGALAGYNWDTGSIVGGLEFKGAFARAYRDNNDGGAGGILDTTNLRSVWSLTGRIGMKADRILIFASGGLAHQELSHTGTSGSCTDERFKARPGGLVLGGGAEYRFANALSARIDVNLYRFKAAQRPTPSCRLLPYEVKNDFDTVTLGVVRHF